MNSTSSIITIGREYGSGGRQIGQEVAKYFGIKCYDKELLEHAANESGICKELFENHDERPTNSFLYSLVMDTYSFGYSSSGFTDMPMNHKVFLAQFDAIKKLASEGPCVMVGRCADYALSEYKDCFSVFVHADTDWRINRLSQKHNKTAKEAKDMINKTDKSRSSYYNYYTNKKWGAASSYNLCVDSSKLGIDGAAKAIIQYEKIGDKIREQETLVMKMQVHDNFGRSLLSIRRILERKEDPDKMDKQLSVLKHLVYILTGSAVESMEEVYKDTVRHAEELGISVQISGNFPLHPSYRLLTDRAIRECVTNCARHAHGSTVWVKIDKNADEYTVQITNDGEVPDKNAEEGGGLSALRKAAESGKCRMQVSFSPEFCLILKMPLTERMGFDGTDTDSRRSEDHAEVF